MDAAEATAQLQAFVAARERLVVLSGAGCSVASGIPDYRGVDGEWKRRPPVLFRDFMDQGSVRRRYWARSFAGWPRFVTARPNVTHQALAQLEADGRLYQLITQNVDSLHQAAGQRKVIDLHGRLAQVRCMSCETRVPRALVQDRLAALNPGFGITRQAQAPDGDADIDPDAQAGFQVPDCTNCGGILKPDVVFFGEAIPRPRVEACMAAVANADGLLVVGSSLMVFSGYRLVRSALQQGIPVVALNLGRTRADEEIERRIPVDCGKALVQLLAAA